MNLLLASANAMSYLRVHWLIIFINNRCLPMPIRIWGCSSLFRPCNRSRPRCKYETIFIKMSNIVTYPASIRNPLIVQNLYLACVPTMQLHTLLQTLPSVKENKDASHGHIPSQHIRFVIIHVSIEGILHPLENIFRLEL